MNFFKKFLTQRKINTVTTSALSALDVGCKIWITAFNTVRDMIADPETKTVINKDITTIVNSPEGERLIMATLTYIEVLKKDGPAVFEQLKLFSNDLVNLMDKQIQANQSRMDVLNKELEVVFEEGMKEFKKPEEPIQ